MKVSIVLGIYIKMGHIQVEWSPATLCLYFGQSSSQIRVWLLNLGGFQEKLLSNSVNHIIQPWMKLRKDIHIYGVRGMLWAVSTHSLGSCFPRSYCIAQVFINKLLFHLQLGSRLFCFQANLQAVDMHYFVGTYLLQ